MKSIKFIQVTLLLVLGAALAVGLSAYAWAGSFARLWADDFCYSAVVQDYGVLAGTGYWYQVGGNRFSALWGVALSDLFGAEVSAWLPGVMVILWVSAGWFTLANLAKRLGWSTKWTGWTIIAALALVYFNFLMAPHLLQSLFWRMGMLHYTLPLVIFVFSLGSLVRAWPRQNESKQRLWPTAVTSAGLAFVAAGLSETYAAFQAGALLAGLFLGVILVSRSLRLRVVALLSPALIFSLLAMGIMALAPANAWRQAALPPPASTVDLIGYTLRYAQAFVIDSLRTLPLPGLVFTALFFGFGVLVGQQPEGNWKKKQLSIGFFLALLLGFGLILCAIAPSVYAGLQYPAGRALTVARFAYLLGLGGAALIAGCLANRMLPGNLRPLLIVAALLIFFASSLYTIRSLTYPINEGQVLQVKAQRWDARHELIQEARSTGLRDLRVQEVDVVSSLEDIGPNPEYWVNGCVAQYYGLDSITALP
jgi:hypothetical protein